MTLAKRADPKDPLQPGRPPRRPPVLCPRQLPLTLFLGMLPSHPHGAAWWLSLVWSRTWQSLPAFHPSDTTVSPAAIRRTDTISLLGQWLRILLPTQPQAQWGHSFDPRSGNIPHTVEQLSPFTTATEPVCLEPGLCNRRSHRHETREEPPHPDQSQRAANQPSQKKKKPKVVASGV